MKIVTIDGLDFAIQEGAKYFSIVQERMERVGQVVKFKRYDVTGDEPVFVDEFDWVVSEDDLEIIRADNAYIGRN